MVLDTTGPSHRWLWPIGTRPNGNVDHRQVCLVNQTRMVLVSSGQETTLYAATTP
jgi:hypothetical protein